MRSLEQIILEQEKSKKQKEYQEFFDKKLEKYGVDSPADLSEEDKKKFFNEIDSEWKGEDVSEMAEPVEEDPGADVESKVKDDAESQENGGGAGKEIKQEKGDGTKTEDEIEDERLKQSEPTDGGDGSSVVTDDQDVKSLKESVGDKKLLVRKLDSIVGSTIKSALKKVAEQLSKKGFTAEEIQTYLDEIEADIIGECLNEVLASEGLLESEEETTEETTEEETTEEVTETEETTEEETTEETTEEETTEED